MAHQISLFVENKPGKLDAVLASIIGKKIDIKAFMIASAGKFGVIKLLVDEPFKAREMLKDAGHAVALEEVVVVEIRDMPQGIKDITDLFASKGINIENAYGFSVQEKPKSLFIIETKEPSNIKEIVTAKGFKVLSDAQIYAL
ncbi:MAG: acetolactate synthase [Deltaproteobacteria bacterium]|nr:acetolactate synthase [Deltaproteobacteria bacterium]